MQCTNEVVAAATSGHNLKGLCKLAFDFNRLIEAVPILAVSRSTKKSFKKP